MLVVYILYHGSIWLCFKIMTQVLPLVQTSVFFIFSQTSMWHTLIIKPFDNFYCLNFQEIIFVLTGSRYTHTYAKVKVYYVLLWFPTINFLGKRKYKNVWTLFERSWLFLNKWSNILAMCSFVRSFRALWIKILCTRSFAYNNELTYSFVPPNSSSCT